MKYYCIMQHDITDCAAACLSTISKQYGLEISIAKIREKAKTDINGTSVAGVIKAANELGFTAKGFKGNIESIYSKFPLPAIAHINNNGILHFVVIHMITKKYLLIADPANGLIKVSYNEFKDAWTGILIFIIPKESFKKGSLSKSSFANFFELLIPHKKIILQVIIASILVNSLGIVSALYFQIVIDDILSSGIINTLHIISIGIIIVNVFSSIIIYFRSQILLFLGQKLDITLLFGYYEHVLKLPISFFGTRKIGEIISRFQDASIIKDSITNIVLILFINVTMSLVGAVLLILKNLYLFLIALLMVVLYAILVLTFATPIKNANEEQMNENAKLNSYLIESINGISTIKSFNKEKKIENIAENKFVKLLKKIFHIHNIINIQELLKTLVDSIGGVTIIWAGAYFVINNKMTIGGLMSFNALLVYFVDPIKSIINLQTNLQSSIVAANRLYEITELDAEDMDNDNRILSPENLKEDIIFENVNFRYGAHNLVLKNLNFIVRKRSLTAIIGESGSGKSTIAKLLLNFYNIEKGNIRIGDYSIFDINREKLRDKIAIVSQDTFLFSGSIYENLTFGCKNIIEDDFIKYTKITKVHDFVDKLKGRYDTQIVEGGTNLSGGQKQRISLARALLKKPDILILDEATSNMDGIIEHEIINNIRQLTEYMTIIVISHKIEIGKICDNILVLKNGEIFEKGTNDSLLKNQQSYYSTLYNSQKY